jgi:hypothetical protein
LGAIRFSGHHPRAAELDIMGWYILTIFHVTLVHSLRVETQGSIINHGSINASTSGNCLYPFHLQHALFEKYGFKIGN